MDNGSSPKFVSLQDIGEYHQKQYPWSKASIPPTQKTKITIFIWRMKKKEEKSNCKASSVFIESSNQVFNSMVNLIWSDFLKEPTIHPSQSQKLSLKHDKDTFLVVINI